MKIFISGVVLLPFLLSVITATAQTQVSDRDEVITLHVAGVCGMCKARIEQTAYDVRGVRSASWDIATDTLTVVARKNRVHAQTIADALAAAGHRSELAKADPKIYASLPACCKYDDGVQKHGIDH